MKKLIKSVFALVAAIGIIALSSCHRQTCPTYTKAEFSVQEAQV